MSCPFKCLVVFVAIIASSCHSSQVDTALRMAGADIYIFNI